MATTLPNTGAVIPAMTEPADQAVNNAAFTAIDTKMGALGVVNNARAEKGSIPVVISGTPINTTITTSRATTQELPPVAMVTSQGVLGFVHLATEWVGAYSLRIKYTCSANGNIRYMLFYTD